MKDLKIYINELISEGIINIDTAQHLMFLIKKIEK